VKYILEITQLVHVLPWGAHGMCVIMQKERSGSLGPHHFVLPLEIRNRPDMEMLTRPDFLFWFRILSTTRLGWGRGMWTYEYGMSY
jgi:hypothetical protein